VLSLASPVLTAALLVVVLLLVMGAPGGSRE